jgi:predicted outer membrane repeat protein
MDYVRMVMKSKFIFCVSLLMLVQAVASAATFTIPSRTYRTIQQGIDYARLNGYDTLEVEQGVYSGLGNTNLDFHGAAITVRSKINPADPCWGIIEATIIDCCGVGNLNSSADADNNPNANRAFWFHNGETSASKVIGFTIRNGYARGPKGADGNTMTVAYTAVWHDIPYLGGTAPWQTFPTWQQALASNPPIDPCTLPPIAFDGNNASGNGYGGAILCSNNSSPTISCCVIENCTAIGALGGRGATGVSGQWFYYTWADFNWADGNTYHKLLGTATLKNTTNGQGGGNGGMGSGNGYGGAIAMRNNSSPEIDNCRFINNSAQGGQGGAGGRGGNAAYPPSYNSGLEGGGGDAGDSYGNGIGGAIYAETLCQPVFNNCLFKDNVAKTGPRGQAGGRGQGNVNIITTNGVATRVSAGLSSLAFTSSNPAIAGGAAYFENSATPTTGPTFTDCNFINNKAYVAFFYDPNIQIGYGIGYLYPQGVTSYSKGTAEDIMGYTIGGAVYFGNNCQGTISTCDFIKNGGDALYLGQGGNFSINNDSAVGRRQPGRKNLFQGNNAPDDTIMGYYTVLSSGSGGAIYVNPGCSIDISNSIFNENTAKINGGAIESQSDLTISDCAFSDNTAIGSGDFTGFGGAIDVYRVNTILTIDANSCSFIDNKSVQGGALSSENFQGGINWNGFNNCIFTDNQAQTGGALELSMGHSTVTIAGNVFRDNVATSGDGGGIDCFYTSADINSCEFFDNSAEGTFAYGGGIDIYGAEGTGHTIRNSLFVGNSSKYNGGAVACEGDAVAPRIQSCTFSQNTANQSGGSIYADWSATPQIRDCIVQKSNNYAIYKDNAGGSASYCLFYNNPDGNVSGIPSGSNNLVGDPLFVTGNLGDYYLSQTTAGQTTNSPAVNSGSVLASALGLNTKTTSTNDDYDIGQVDRGYHFSRAVDMPQFRLTISVVGGIGTISVLPAPLPDGNYYAGTVVTVTATPQTGWVIKQWTGTDNDSEVTTTQTVVMNSNRAVTVEFKQPTYLYVGPYADSSYPDILAAMAAASDGDIIVVAPGRYPSAQIQFTKSVEVRSEQPENPDYVTQTILDFNNLGNTNNTVSSAVGGIFFPQGMNSGCILNGFTIRNSNWVATSGDAGTNPGENGGDGLGVEGGAIWIGPGAGPVIKNCIIRDNSMRGGFGANGANADLYHNAGRGGWGAWARGGAVYCSVNSHPKFINCQILNNRVVGGFGGNGGNEAIPGGLANYGGNYSRAAWWDYDPREDYPDWVEGDLWVKWTEMAPYIPLNTIGKGHRGSTNYQYLDDYENYQYGYIGDYRWYSGYGGGVYVNTGSNVTFTNCVISNNLAQGGFSGLGGTDSRYTFTVAPLTKYEIPAFGGGVYVAAASNVVFNGCVISNNTASNPTFDHRTVVGGVESSYLPTNYDPLNHYRIDSYLGHGGGVCAEDTAKVTFVDCNFTSNNASVGGGLFGSDASLVLSDCEFVSNTAYQGGGMFGQNGSISINRSIFNSNTSSADIYEPNVLGQGGGLNFFSANANIVDTNISGNNAQEIGGGLFFGGGGLASLHNCLITNNSAGQMGGAVAATISSQLQVANCTIVNNAANLGGGLFSHDGSFVDVINSIIWDNRAGLGANGSQIAVRGGELPSSIQVRYSDVQDSNDPCAWTNDINTLDFVICFDTTGSMGGDIDAVRTAARRIINAIDANYADNRLGLVDFRDYPDGNYGSLGDWPYLDRVKFTTDANQLINGLQPMVAGGGADGPEAIYTALMHCIDANALVARLTANGHTNYIDSNSPGLGNWRQGRKVMRVILLLTDAPPHDPEKYTNYVLNDIITAANGRDPIHVIPVVIRGDAGAENALRPVAVGTGGTLILATDSNAVPGAVLNAIGLLSQIPVPISVGPNSTINWNPTTFNWEPNSHNINADPLFVGGFFLSQIDAGQLINSPCWNAGSANVNSPDINLGGYTTRTDSVPDAGMVDMGYHYPPFMPVQYRLDFNAVEVNGLKPTIIQPTSSLFNSYTRVYLEVNSLPDGYQVQWTGTENDDINGVNNSVVMNGNKTVTVAFVRNTCNLTVLWNDGGTVTPTSGTYPRNTDVNLIATPDAGYRIESWEGTNDNNSVARTNKVTMNGDKTVRVTFSLPQTRTVPGDFTTIQAAVEGARSGDIVIVESGVYHITSNNGLVINKEITIASTNPDDPCVIAATIIDLSYGEHRVHFGAGAGLGTIFDGFTLTSGSYSAQGRPDGAIGQDGLDGFGLAGGVVVVESYARPTIRNCVIRDTTITGGNAGNGGGSDVTNNAGRGGWAGWARGGGIYIAPFANPTLTNCTITNCTVVGGNGGNGGNSTAGGGNAGYGGNWSDGTLWRTWGYVNDYRWYSGYGGGVYCDANSEANFIACTITNNTARGGLSGTGGAGPGGPVDPCTPYRIPSYGGGVYCGENADVNFRDCVISGNIAPRPDATYHIDPYLGYGGGIAFEDTASILLQNCTISDNSSAVGGGMFWAGGTPEVLDCEIMRNTAYLGGGIYAMDSAGQIKGCTLRNNFAGVLPGDVDVIAGQGGGIFGSSIDTVIADCLLTDNTSSTSGGGIHIYGPGDANTIIRNCLLTGNQAGRDGGGISTNWGAVVSVDNCTLYSNQATGTFGVSGNTGFGGGLYCSYSASTDIKNSIFWDNNGLFGNEIAEATGFEGSPLCGDVSISYCDIRGGQASSSVYISSGCSNNWGLGNINIDPRFVNVAGGNFHLQHITAGQSVNSPCIDAGGDLAVSVGLSRYSTSTLGTSDTGIVDLGYHYPIADYCRRWDLFLDNLIDFRDLAIFAKSWVGMLGNENLGYNEYDLYDFTTCWLYAVVQPGGGGDTTPPTPNPMQWASLPAPATASSVTMAAATATDDGGGPVWYEFQETTGNAGGTSSGWQTSSVYTDTGLQGGTQYCYRVRARDEFYNMTDWSEEACVANVGDINAPVPNPMTWAIPPRALNGSSVEMRASTAVDDSNGQVYYQFDQVGGPLSAWQTDTYYVATGLNPTGVYCFRVRARDQYNNITAWSEPACVSDIADIGAPTPPTFVAVAAQQISRTDPNTASGQFEWDPATFQDDWWHRVIIDVTNVTDNVTPTSEIEVRFICSNSKYSSDNVVPAAFRPIRIGHPVAIGERVIKNGQVDSGYRLIWNGTNQIVYDVYVDAWGGSYGKQLDWHVCVYDASGNSACTATFTIPR